MDELRTRVSFELPSPEKPAPTKPAEPEKLFTFSAKDANLDQVLTRLLSEHGYNILWEKGLNRKVPITVNFRNVTLKEGLDIIFASADYCYELDDKSLHISFLGTRYYEIGYVSSATVSEVSVGGDVLGKAISGESGSGSGLSGKFEISGGTERSSMDFWSQVNNAVQTLLSSDGSYSINRLAGVVMVTDRNANLRKIEKYLDEVKSSLTRQVVVEAKVLEVGLSDERSYGIDWSAVSDFIVDNTEWTMEATQSLSLEQQVIEVDLSSADGSAIINALGKQGNVEMLSNPRINVMNNQTAVISVGRVLAFWELTGTQAGAEVGTPAVYPQKQSVLLGLLMGVTPYISSDGQVSLHIVPIVSDIASWEEFTWEDQTLRAPNVDIRQTSTIVNVMDGQTVIIGGLMSEKRRIDELKVPLLGDIPVLGWLFKRFQETKSKSELVVLLTPKVIHSYSFEL
jgi:MSHA type pilus biogenesis protein MshL